MKNRLNLDFSIESTEARTSFVENYLQNIKFTPTEDELETIANYILWGKNSDGLNAQQEGAVHIKDWDPSQIDSLEELAESPAIRETSFHDLSYPATKLPKLSFDRQAAINSAPPYLIPIFQELFTQIDQIELTINYYELAHNRRINPPRESLLNKFSEDQLLSIQNKAATLTQFKYLKLRHYLVELRREQYTLKDTYATPIAPSYSTQLGAPIEDEPLSFDNVIVRPAGLFDDSPLSSKLFRESIDPSLFTQEDFQKLSSKLEIDTNLEFDLSNKASILAALQMRADLEEQQEQGSDSVKFFLRTLQYYIDQAALSDMQLEILDYKLQKRSNIIISQLINQKYHKNYNDNYISTIFHQKILNEISEAVQYHAKVIENLPNPSAFKTCKDCGRVLLKDTRNFMRFQKSKDGFSPRCKVCEKIKRGKNK